MVKIRVLIILLAMLMTSCFTTLRVGGEYTKYGTTVKIVEWDAGSEVRYKDYEYLLQDLKERAKTMMWSQERLDHEISSLPKGGYLIVYIKGLSIDDANTENWEYQVRTMDDKPIKRKQGEYDIPKATVTEYGSYWRNVDIINLHTKPKGAFKVYVIFKIPNKRSCFVVHPNK